MQSGAVLLELSRPRMRDSGRDQLPPDVRFAGKPAEMRAPPWITVRQRSLLTETPSCEAEHMAAPTKPANVKKALANSEPSTHGTNATGFVNVSSSGRPEVPADRQNDVNDPEADFRF
jgi:hypothetical protein